MTDTNTNVQEDKKDAVTATAAVSGEEKKVEAQSATATETKVEEKKVVQATAHINQSFCNLR